MKKYVPENIVADMKMLEVLETLMRMDNNVLSYLSSGFTFGFSDFESVVKNKNEQEIVEIFNRYKKEYMEVGDVVKDYSGDEYIVERVNFSDDGKGCFCHATGFNGKMVDFNYSAVTGSYTKTDKKFRIPRKSTLSATSEANVDKKYISMQKNDTPMSILEAVRLMYNVSDEERGRLFYGFEGKKLTVEELIASMDIRIFSTMACKIQFYLLPDRAVVTTPSGLTAILVKNKDDLFTGHLLFDDGDSVTTSYHNSLNLKMELGNIEW